MENVSTRRRSQRVTPPEVLPASMGLRRDLRVINLSAEGAMIEHAERLSPGHTCALGLRLAGVDLSLHARVVWSQAYSAGSGPPVQREIRYRSRLHFPRLSEAAASHFRQYLTAVIGRKATPTYGLGNPTDISRTSWPSSPIPAGRLDLGRRGGNGRETPEPGLGQPAGSGLASRSVGSGDRRLPLAEAPNPPAHP